MEKKHTIAGAAGLMALFATPVAASVAERQFFRPDAINTVCDSFEESIKTGLATNFDATIDELRASGSGFANISRTTISEADTTLPTAVKLRVRFGKNLTEIDKNASVLPSALNMHVCAATYETTSPIGPATPTS